MGRGYYEDFSLSDVSSRWRKLITNCRTNLFVFHICGDFTNCHSPTVKVTISLLFPVSFEEKMR